MRPEAAAASRTHGNIQVIAAAAAAAARYRPVPARRKSTVKRALRLLRPHRHSGQQVHQWSIQWRSVAAPSCRRAINREGRSQRDGGRHLHGGRLEAAETPRRLSLRGRPQTGAGRGSSLVGRRLVVGPDTVTGITETIKYTQFRVVSPPQGLTGERTRRRLTLEFHRLSIGAK